MPLRESLNLTKLMKEEILYLTKLMEEENPPWPLATATPASGRKMYEEVSKHKKIAEMRGRSVSSRVEGAAEMRSTSERSGEMRDLENLGRLPQKGPETTFI